MINAAVILSGGTGSRMKMDMPKQYCEVNNKPIILYSLQAFEENADIDVICIVASEKWISFLQDIIKKNDIRKKIIFAYSGKNRQRSIFNGLKVLEKCDGNDVKNVVIHDAARPFVTQKLIDACLNIDDEYDGVIPVIPVKDTCYICDDDGKITYVPERKKLFAGQAPEGFNFRKYLKIHYEADDECIDFSYGSTEFAFKNGLNIKSVPGDERNFKITVSEDLKKMKLYL